MLHIFDIVKWSLYLRLRHRQLLEYVYDHLQGGVYKRWDVQSKLTSRHVTSVWNGSVNFGKFRTIYSVEWLQPTFSRSAEKKQRSQTIGHVCKSVYMCRYVSTLVDTRSARRARSSFVKKTSLALLSQNI